MKEQMNEFSVSKARERERHRAEQEFKRSSSVVFSVPRKLEDVCSVYE
jgi:hypothetical protein